MIANRPLARQIVLAITVVLVGAALFLASFSAGSAGGGSIRDEAHARSFPDWFWPIWDYYDRNPAVTPAFDFALLYDSRDSAHIAPRAMSRPSARR